MTIEKTRNKQCKSCNKILENTEEFFYRLSPLKDGELRLAATCKECQRARKRYLYSLNPDAEKERHRKWVKNNREHQNNYAKSRYVGEQRDKIIQRQKEYYNRNKPAIRERFIQSNYGVTADFIRDLMDTQRGCCAICNTSLIRSEGDMYCIDHDHSTGKVRGLLCCSCNFGIGSFKENKDILLNAITYLTSHNTGEIDASQV